MSSSTLVSCESSHTSGTTESQEEAQLRRSVFVCGFIPKRWHNSSLQVIVQDLLPSYYVACNSECWADSSEQTRALLSTADILLFFVNEFTLANSTCLLTLQYAWHLMIPIIMLRPPRTKLVICKRGEYREDIIVVGNGSIVRSPLTRWALLEDSTVHDIDYYLLQDVLYEGYKISVIYDRLEHKKSMTKLLLRIENTLRPELKSRLGKESRTSTREGSRFYLSSNSHNSDSNNSLVVNLNNGSSRSLTEKSREDRLSASSSKGGSSKERKERSGDKQSLSRPELRISISRSTGNLSSTSPIDSRGKSYEREERREGKRSRVSTPTRRRAYRKTPFGYNKDKDVFIINESPKALIARQLAAATNGVPQNSSVDSEGSKKASDKDNKRNNSAANSIERRMSMNSLDDPANFQQTQYLVFPVKDNTQQPVLFKFPSDLQEEVLKDDTVWGSDTSLEREAEIADKLQGGFSLEDVDDSPIHTPAPSYIGDLK